MKKQHSETKLASSVAAAVLLAFSGGAGAASFQLPGTSTTLDVGGYAKLDIVWNDESSGDTGDDSLVNREYTPALIPLKDQPSGEDGQIVFNGRESRIWVRTSTPGANGDIKTHIEFDFDTSEGNQGISNSQGARIRHAYGTYRNVLFGQTWSTFMYLPGLPETNDFGGPTGDIFVRQGQVRFTWPMAGGSSIDLAFENPETSTDSLGRANGVGLVDDDKIPDVIGRYNTKNWSVAALVRQLNVEKGAVDDDDTAVAVQFGWNYPFGNVTFKGMVTAGEGFGRYMLRTHADAVVVGSAIDSLEAVGGFASLQFKTGGPGNGRINLVLGATNADDPAGVAGTNAVEETTSLHVNYMWNPEKSIRHGIELLFATADEYNGTERELTRVQWSTMFVF